MSAHPLNAYLWREHSISQMRLVTVSVSDKPIGNAPVKPTINLGCGNDEWGDVRVDLDTASSAANYEWNLDRMPLPFHDKQFSEARLFHVLEHMDRPQALFNEAVRIADSVHCKFPTRLDRLPDLLHELTDLHFRKALWHLHWKFVDRSHPMFHHWIILPFGETELHTCRIPSLFLSGRKARFLSRFTVSLPLEWECRLSRQQSNYNR